MWGKLIKWFDDRTVITETRGLILVSWWTANGWNGAMWNGPRGVPPRVAFRCFCFVVMIVLSHGDR